MSDETGLDLTEPNDVMPAAVVRKALPAAVVNRFYNNCPMVEDLHCMRNWLAAERAAGPEGSRFKYGIWHEDLLAKERTLAQAYKDMGLAAPESQTGKAVQVFKDHSNDFKPKVRGERKFNDNTDDEYKPPPGTLGDYVMMRCGVDSQEWQDYLRLKGLFGVAKEEPDDSDSDGVAGDEFADTDPVAGTAEGNQVDGGSETVSATNA